MQARLPCSACLLWQRFIFGIRARLIFMQISSVYIKEDQRGYTQLIHTSVKIKQTYLTCPCGLFSVTPPFFCTILCVLSHWLRLVLLVYSLPKQICIFCSITSVANTSNLSYQSNEQSRVDGLRFRQQLLFSALASLNRRLIDEHYRFSDRF